MSETTKTTPRGKRTMRQIMEQEPDFIRASELAYRMGLGDTRTLYDAIGEGKVPPPHCEFSERITLWRRDHFEYFRKHGIWPKEAWKKRD